MYMNAIRRFFGIGRRRRRPIPTISIPNFHYPADIFSYLMSQSGAYKITYVAPSGEHVEVAMPSDDNPLGTISPESISSTSSPNITPAAATQESRPAYSTFTTPPINNSSPTPSPSPTTTPPINLSPGLPPFWVAAIRAMYYTRDFSESQPITDYDTLTKLYSNLASEITSIMSDGQKGNTNAAAVIYFCTVTSILFQSFNQKPYNYLNSTFPKIFNDITYNDETITGTKTYSKFIKINSYSKNMKSLLKKYKYGYISTQDKVMKYSAPIMLKNILDILNDVPPTPE